MIQSQIQKNNQYMFLFGDKNFGINDFSGGYRDLKSEMYQRLVESIFESSTTKLMRQVHGINGTVITDVHQSDSVECDFLITNQSKVVLLVLTAD
jgi:copper oxidase (laccase) domain-containing protein